MMSADVSAIQHYSLWHSPSSHRRRDVTQSDGGGIDRTVSVWIGPTTSGIGQLVIHSSDVKVNHNLPN